LGLFERRRRRLRFSLELLIEQSERIVPTADSIVRAVRAYACLNDAGEWIEPASHVVVSSGSVLRDARPFPAPQIATSSELPSEPSSFTLIDTQVETETAVSD